MKTKKLKKLKLQKETIAKINLNKIVGGQKPKETDNPIGQSYEPACTGA